MASSTCFPISVLLLSMFVVASANGYAYLPKVPKVEKPKPVKELIPLTIAIQGIIYCKQGPKLIPIQGAVSRITCLAEHKNGYETAPFSILSRPTDAKGYFFATICPSELEESWKLKECKAFLESSPSETCNVPTDVNHGISGSLLSVYTLLRNKHMKLHSVGPFVYTPQPKLVPRGY